MEVAPFAIIGAVVGFIVRQWLDSRILRTTNTAT